MKIYGIKNCNTVKKALDWFNLNNIPFEFIDFKKIPADDKLISSWLKHKPWKDLVNTKGTTYRMLSDDQKALINNDKAALTLMIEKNSVIKRPVIEISDNIILGFDEELYKATFLK